MKLTKKPDFKKASFFTLNEVFIVFKELTFKKILFCKTYDTVMVSGQISGK
jgi:hypothetical protein